MKEFTMKSIEGKLLLIATILASGMAFLDGSVVNIAVPTLQSQFHATLTDIQWIINSYSLLLCSLILISGALGDRFGRKRIFIAGITLFTLSSFLCGISHSILSLTLFRAVQGIGGAMMVPGSLSIINAAFKTEVRGKAIGLWSGFAGGLSALGPFLGGWLVQTFGWQSIFFINVPLGILAFIIAVKYVPESKNKESTKVDVTGAVLIFLSLLGVVYGLITGPDAGWKSGPALLSLVVGLVLFIVFLFSQTKVKEPLIPFQIFRSSLVSGANTATLFLYFALSGVIFFLVLNLQQVQHYTPIMAGLATLPTILLITFLSGPGGTLADKIGPRLPMIVGPFIVSAGMLLLAFSGENASYLTQFLPGLVLFGLGMSLVIAPLTKSALAVDQKYSGAASGVNNAVARVAGLLAIALLGVVVLSIFKTELHRHIFSSKLSLMQRKSILFQENKLSGIDIPTTFTSEDKRVTTEFIDSSFLVGFKWAMIINAVLAFLSGVVSIFTIHNEKRR